MNCYLDGELSHWHSYHIFLYLMEFCCTFSFKMKLKHECEYICVNVLIVPCMQMSLICILCHFTSIYMFNLHKLILNINCILHTIKQSLCCRKNCDFTCSRRYINLVFRLVSAPRKCQEIIVYLFR